MKKIIDWFSEQKEPHKSKLIKALNTGNDNHPVATLADAINEGISWHATDDPNYFNQMYSIASMGGTDLAAEMERYAKRVALQKNFKCNREEGLGHMYTMKLSREFTVSFAQGIFGNCQNFVIGYFNKIIENATAEEFPEIIYYFREMSGMKKMMVIDVEERHVARVKELFDNIVVEAPYVSTNAHKMCIFNINVSAFK